MSPEEILRPSDYARVDRALEDIKREQALSSGKLSDLRVLMAEGYPKKADLEVVKTDLRREFSDETREIQKQLSEHVVSDEKAIGSLRNMLWGLLAGILLTFGSLIALLVVEVAKTAHGG